MLYGRLDAAEIAAPGWPLPAGDQVDITSHVARLGEGKQLIRPRASRLLAGGLAVC